MYILIGFNGAFLAGQACKSAIILQRRYASLVREEEKKMFTFAMCTMCLFFVSPAKHSGT